MHVFLKIFSGMANSMNSDQTAPSGNVWSESTPFAYYTILSGTLVYKILEHLPDIYITHKREVKGLDPFLPCILINA